MRSRSYWNAVGSAAPAHKWIGAMLGVGAIALFVVILVTYCALLAGIKQTLGRSGLQILIGETVRYLFLFLIAGGVPFVSGVLFTAGDLPLLAAAPIRPAAIVCGRLFDAVVVASAQFVVIGIPLLVACAWALNLSALGWLAFVFLVTAFLALPALLVALLLLVFARVAGLRRVRAVVAATSAIFAVAICLLLVTTISRRSSVQGAGSNPMSVAALTAPGAAQSAFKDVEVPSPLLPSTWMTNGLTGLGDRRATGKAILGAGELVGCTVLLGLLCLVIGGPVLVGERLLEGDSGDSGAGTAAARIHAVLKVLPIPSPVRAIIARDILAAGRDIVLLSQIGIPLILFLVPFAIGAQLGTAGAASGDMAGFSLAVVGTVAFMETSILSLSSIGLEGSGFWMVMSAPVKISQLLYAKWISAWGGSIVLTAPLLIVTAVYYHLPISILEIAFVLLMVTNASLCAFGVGLSGLFPRFLYDNPAHRASVAALIWGFVGSTVYVLLGGIPLGAALYLAPQTPEWAARIVMAGVGWFLLLSVLTGLVPILMARIRLGAYAWEE